MSRKKRGLFRPPMRFQVSVDTAFGSDYSYEYRDGEVRSSLLRHEFRVARPSREQWSGFWRLCDFIGLWDWLPEYDDRGLSRDGQSWEIDIAFDNTKFVASRGINAYPSLEDPKCVTSVMDRFGLLLQFIDMSLMATRPDVRNFYRALHEE